MSKSRDSFYFNNFVECCDIALEASSKLKEVLLACGLDILPEQLEQIHAIEHRGDIKHHELIAQIAKDFITPLEREDIIDLSNHIDDVTDSIEDIIINIYLNNETKVREDSHAFADIVIRCCTAVKELLIEFPNYRKSKILNGMIANIHHIEEEGDAMFLKSMKELHTTITRPLTVIAWREIYGYFEKCCDTCADVADIVERIAIGNI
ncbi:MAG: DUF47 family protein [Clostridia bacterium]